MQSRPAAIVPDKPVAGLVASLPAAIPATPLVTPQAEAPAVIVADAGVSAMPVKTADAQPSDAAPVQAQSQVAHEQSLGPKEELLPPVATAVQAPPVLNAPAPAAISPTIPTIAAPGRPASKPALAEKAPAIAAAKPAANGATTAKTIQKDGDVELIAALLNRVATRPDAPASDTVRKARPDEMQKSAAAGTPKKNRKTAGYRELASPKAVDATMAQLERCNTLGFFEAEMCRLRACTGRWGSDPGCPEYAQISSVAP